MKEHVSLDVKKYRLYRLNDKVSHYSSEAMHPYENEVVTVLYKGKSKKDDSVLAGYTDKNKRVNFSAPEEMIGKLMDVRTDTAWRFLLNGTFLQEHKAMVTG